MNHFNSPFSLTRPIGLLTFLSAIPAIAQTDTVPDQHQIVPGQRIGRVFIGDSHGAVVRRLGKPNSIFHLGTDLSSELWRSKTADPDGRLNTLEVIFRRGVVTQIEATSTVFATLKGLTLADSTGDWSATYGAPRLLTFRYPAKDNRKQKYYDWVKSGVAIETQLKGSETIYNTVIVHRRGYRVVTDLGGVAVSS